MSSAAHPASRAAAMASAANRAAPRRSSRSRRVAGSQRSPARPAVDRSGQRVQAADRQALALDLGVAERRRPACSTRATRFCIASISMKASVCLPGSSGARRASFGQRLPVYLPLAHIPPGERRRYNTDVDGAVRRTDPPSRRAAADSCHRCCSTPGHARDQAPGSSGRVGPARPAGPDMLSDQAGQPGALRQGRHRDHQARDAVRVVKRCVRPGQVMRRSHLQGAAQRGLEA